MEIIKIVILILVNIVKYITPGLLLYASIRIFIWLPSRPLHIWIFEENPSFLLTKYGASFLYIIFCLKHLVLTTYYAFTTGAMSYLPNPSIMNKIALGYWGGHNNYLIRIMIWIYLNGIFIPMGLYYLEKRYKKVKGGLEEIEKIKEELNERKKVIYKKEEELKQREKKLPKNREKLEEIIRAEVREEEREKIKKNTIKKIYKKRDQNKNNRDDNKLGLFEND